MGTFPTITGAGTTTATKFFGDAMNRLSNMLNGVDISADAVVIINSATTWTFQNTAFRIQNPAATFSYIFTPAAIVANRTLNLPLLTGTDTLAVLALQQTFTNKNLNASNVNFIDNADNTKILTFSLTGITTGNTRTLTIPDTSSTIAVTGLAQTFTTQQTISPTTATALLLNHPTTPTGSASGFVGALNVVSGGTIAFATTPQTGAFYGTILNAATLTNPSSGTITNAYTLYISGPPIASTNVTITNPYALYINSGTTVLQATTVAGTLTMSSANIALGTNSITGNFTATGSPTVQGSLTVGTGQSGGQTDFIYLLMNNGFGSDYPTTGSGGAIGWNFSSPGVDFWNITTSATTSFVFRQLTGASAQTTLMAISPTGLFSTYATRGTAGLGVATVFGSTLQKSETGADTNVLTLTPPATAGRYRVSVSISVSAASAATLGWTASWKDSNGATQTPANLPLFTQNSTTVGLTISVSANVTYSGSWDMDIDNSATNIVVKTTFTGTSVAYKISAIIEQLA